ncbi:VOC family protein [Aquibacillus halophilus]|uniref:VOC family protein n=1 Tax=Aquibacillus halophilus TaxID=930132 RepID=A0A6A8DK24_9BACI|nr:VOC family protein [Aquibacillus halophilus]MRH41602.1 VOC family protein [Aquibacillus halophilus]
MIKGIGHTAYTVKDMDKALNFYCDVLGFKKVFELDRDGEPWIVYLKICDYQFIELFYGGEKEIEVDVKTIGYSHLCLEVEDIYQISEHIKSKGVKLDKEPKQGVDMNYQSWVSDPDGNKIELMQYHPECPQLTK